MNLSYKTKINLLTMLKLVLGVIIATGISSSFGMKNIYSAGSITLITLLTSKWDTLRISFWRLVTYFITVAVTWVLVLAIPNQILCFGVTVGVLFMISKLLHIQSVLAINGMIASHFIAGHDFSMGMIANEFLLVLISAVTAILLNQFTSKKILQHELKKRMLEEEEVLAGWLTAFADALEDNRTSFPDLESYIDRLKKDLELSRMFDDNSYSVFADYYEKYFSMRLRQAQVLRNLTWEMKHLKTQPEQVHVIAGYIRYLVRYIFETNYPQEQKKKLKELLEKLREKELPNNREDFESRSILYHVLMTLEEFIYLKSDFVKSLNPEQKKEYWKLSEN